jgi:glycosyltransferase involved in cell wall biosynthesis
MAHALHSEVPRAGHAAAAGAAPSPALSIVLPAYNEEGNIERVVREAARAAAALVPDYEIVVVDDGSRDRTPEILAQLVGELGPNLHVVHHPRNLGYGAALRDGFRATRGVLVFYTDSDNQFDLRELAQMLPLMKDCDAALGYRVDRQDAWMRKVVSGGFNRLSSLVFGMSVRDLNCSFKLFRGDLIRGLPIDSTDFFVDTEMVARLHRAGCRYVQRGVRHYPRTAGRSTVRPSDVPRTLVSLARMWMRLRRSGPRRPA